jgi:hypothetical protein
MKKTMLKRKVGLKATKGLSKVRKSTLGNAKRKAWSAFSLYIRTKDSMDGKNVCYTCGSVVDIKKMNAGHGIGGRNNAVLFDERICKPQCVGCNIWGRGNYQVFTRKLIAELGLEGYDEIASHSSDIVKYRVEDYLEIAEMFKKKLEQLQ